MPPEAPPSPRRSDPAVVAAPDCCPHLHAAVELIGRRWTGAILYVLIRADGPVRFGAIRDAVPELSDRLLAARLRELEAHGLVEPAETEPGYVPTSKARALEPALAALQVWGRRWLR